MIRCQSTGWRQRAAKIALTIILSLDEENANLKARVAFIEGQLFGPKSEKMTVLHPTQVALDFGDLNEIPVAANDDVAPVAEDKTQPRRSPSRNIGRLPKHLPRYDEIIEPENSSARAARSNFIASARMSARRSTSCLRLSE